MKRARVLVAVDGSEAAESATSIAAEIAIALKAHLAVVHVEQLGVRDTSAPPPERRAQDALAHVGLEAEIVRRAGDPAEEIIAAARTSGCDLLVMGSRGRSHIAGVLLGSVSQDVVAKAACPVLLVRAGARPIQTPQRIVLAIEGLEGSEPLVTITARLARALGATVSLVHVSYPGGEQLERSLYHAHRTHGEEALDAAAALLAKHGIVADAVPLSSRRGVSKAIARFADAVGAELIVMGSHGEAGGQAAADQSIAVGHLTKRPVLVTREH